MGGDEAEVIWVGEAALDDLKRGDADGGEAFAASAAIFVNDGDGDGELRGE